MVSLWFVATIDVLVLAACAMLIPDEIKAVRLFIYRWLVARLFTLSPKRKKEDRGSTKDKIIGLLSDIVSAVILGIVSMSVILRWAGWLVCWILFLIILCLLLYRVPRITRLLGAMLAVIIFMGIFESMAARQWKEEQAAKTEGDLTGAGPAINDGKPHGFPMLQVGDTVYMMTPDGVADIFPFFKDSGVRIEWGYKGPLLSTPVRDRNGNLIAEITNNHWFIYSLYSANKNYTNNALEIKDSAGHVVLQVQILPDRIKLQGEWWDTQGNGIRLVKPINLPSSSGGSMVIPLGRQNQHIEYLIPPMFQYPSKDHWGELAH